MLQIRLLGGVGAVTPDGRPAQVGPAKCQALLAALALSAGRAVPVWRLTELVWGDAPPRTADRTLASYATRLRGALGSSSIERAGSAYRLDVDPDAVDVLRFRRLAEAGEIEAALAEWTGTPLAGLVAPGLTATVNGLIEQWLAVVEADLEHRVELDTSTVIGQLTELTATYPFREGLWALLMTALYRAGRQADALAAYRTARGRLISQLAVEPGPRLRELEASILGHDGRLARPAAPDTSAVAAAAAAAAAAGTAAAGTAAGTAVAAARPSGTVTFGFCEVADAGRWWASHRHEMPLALARHEVLVRTAVDRHGGQVFASGGDSFGAAFHRAADAVAWALDLQAAARDEAWPAGMALRAQLGLHTGETDERRHGYFGPAVNLAARLAAAGHGGQVLASAATALLLDRDDLRDLGTHRLDGVVSEQRLYQVGHGEHPPPRTEDGRRGNLPRRLGRLLGRDALLDTVEKALTATPVVTLVGPGGIGKTRLAVAAAARRSDLDGTWLIELAEITSSDDVPRAVATPLGITELAGRDLNDSVVTALRPRRALLLLDNCEHVAAGAAKLAAAIAEGCPDVRVLATSREALGLGHGHERLVAVGPLEPSGPGAELFEERATALSAGFDTSANRQAVEEICRRLDGVPLAIELAAARTTTLAPADLLTRLDDHLRLLVGGPRTAAERHRTLRATIAWSYDLLSAAERRLFQRLSVFAGPFDLSGATAVAVDGTDGTGGIGGAGGTGGTDVDQVVGTLVARSMLVVDSGPFGPRFRLLETMRQFAAERLAETGETELVAERHALWCLEAAARVQVLLAGQAEVEGVARLDELWPNLRAAFDWACAAKRQALAHALVRRVVVEIVRRSRNEIGDWVERLLTISPPDDELVVFGLTWAAQRYKLSRRDVAYERLVERYGEPDHPLVHHARASVYQDYAAHGVWATPAIADLRRRGDDDLAEQFELDAGAALLFTGRFAEHDRFTTALVHRYRAQGPPTLLNLTLVMLGYSASLQGDLPRANRLFDEAVGVTVPQRTHSPNRVVEAGAVFRRGDRARAFGILRGHIDQLLDDDNMQAACVTSVEFINMMAAVGRLPDAARMLGFLATTGLLDAPDWNTLVDGAATAIAAQPHLGPEREQAWGRALDDREALEYMREVLRTLADADA
ncbi:AfsR/SARP family transcriptional regulator [Parafrankia elaeagni]|uniref:AfsR/SARP family transcriptional regulator n=1 Tax=Parafrankia elaeagni TaxID=222534 RepID=UPI000361DAFF|nr:BTAD domain-containing putative transcriptional regulator [Parafrankia elaeagni]